MKMKKRIASLILAILTAVVCMNATAADEPSTVSQKGFIAVVNYNITDQPELITWLEAMDFMTRATGGKLEIYKLSKADATLLYPDGDSSLTEKLNTLPVKVGSEDYNGNAKKTQAIRNALQCISAAQGMPKNTEICLILDMGNPKIGGASAERMAELRTGLEATSDAYPGQTVTFMWKNAETEWNVKDDLDAKAANEAETNGLNIRVERKVPDTEESRNSCVVDVMEPLTAGIHYSPTVSDPERLTVTRTESERTTVRLTFPDGVDAPDTVAMENIQDPSEQVPSFYDRETGEAWFILQGKDHPGEYRIVMDGKGSDMEPQQNEPAVETTEEADGEENSATASEEAAAESAETGEEETTAESEQSGLPDENVAPAIDIWFIPGTVSDVTVTDRDGMEIKYADGTEYLLRISARITGIPVELCKPALVLESEKTAELVCDEPPVNDGNGVWSWNAKLTALEPGSTISFAVSVDCQGTVMAQSDQSVTLTVHSAPPEIRSDAITDYTYYFDIPGQEQEETKREIILSELFTDPDENDREYLTYTIQNEDELNNRQEFSYKLDGKVLSYKPLQGKKEDTDIILVAHDRSGQDSAPLTITVRQYPIRAELDEMRADAENGTCTYRVHQQDQTISFTIQQDQLTVYDGCAEKGYVQKAEDALTAVMTVEQDGITDGPRPAVVERTGEGLLFTFTMPETEKSNPQPVVTLKCTYQGRTIDENTYALRNLFSEINVEVTNDNPTVVADAGKQELTFTWNDLFSQNPLQITLPPEGKISNLFCDAESTAEQMTYWVSYSGPEEMTGNLPETETEINGGEPHLFEIPAPGTMTVTLTANDGENRSDGLVYSITVNSLKKYVLIYGGAAVILLVIIIILAKVIRKKSKPSFSSRAEFGCERMQSMTGEGERELSSYPNVTITLNRYGQESVSLLTLMMESGELPPKGIDAKTLEAIILKPEKNGIISMSAPQNIKLIPEGGITTGAHGELLISSGKVRISSSNGQSETLSIHIGK